MKCGFYLTVQLSDEDVSEERVKRVLDSAKEVSQKAGRNIKPKFLDASRRGWNMTTALPELRGLPSGLVLDGELVAWKDREPYFPLVCRRVLNRDASVPIRFVVFDLLWREGDDLTPCPYSERREALESAKLDGSAWTTSETFDDGPALFTAVCRLGYEGVVAKNHASTYRPGERGWVKVKNPDYWRRDSEMEAMQKAAERRARAVRFV